MTVFQATDVDKGQAVYNRFTLTAYDAFVLGFSNHWLWRCPTKHLRALYQQQVTPNHLDVGVGTGYFLDHVAFAKPPRIGLMDLNPTTLAFSAERLARYQPALYARNILAQIDFSDDKFDSIGMNFLLHCLPGDIVAKSIAFDHLKVLLNPGGVLFGSTIVQGAREQGDLPRNWGARRLMALYNRKGIFSNTEDTVDGLKMALEQRFKHVEIQVIGSVVIFSARD